MTNRLSWVNSRLDRRPKYKGLPIPYVQYIRSDGIPDFRTVDDEKRWECVEKGLCGLCGEPLGYYIAFIGGDLSVKNRAYLEPPMHVLCIEDAMKLCPFLCKGRDFQGLREDPNSDKTVTEEEAISAKRPDRMAILVTRNYKVKTKLRTKVIEPGRAVSIAWYDENGDLIEVER